MGGRFTPGQSGNPKGRPRGAAGLAAYIREQTNDLQELADIALKIARSPNTQARDRLAALELLQTRAIGKPDSKVTIDAHVTAVGVSMTLDPTRLTPAQVIELDELLGAATAMPLLPAPEGEEDGDVSDSEM